MMEYFLEEELATVMEPLKPTEAAVVARVHVRDVHRVIDERILPDAFYWIDDGRSISATGCVFISFYFDSAKRLTADERLVAIREVGSRVTEAWGWASESWMEGDWVFHDEFLTIDLFPFVERTRHGLERLAAARELVTSDSHVLGGTPVVRGTRIPVHDVAAPVAAGIPIKRILDAYPALDEEKIELATIYAEANPPRGRPRTKDALPAGATLISERRAPRRRTDR
jgi:uncharacterized protein (DUF433 family)